MIRKKYILRDAVNRREFRKYVQRIIQLIKNVSLNELQNQLNIIYNDINSSFKKNDIKKFKTDMNVILNNLMKNLDEIKHDWWDYDSKTLRNQASRFSFNINSQNNQSIDRRDDRDALSYDQYNIQSNRFSFRLQSFNIYQPFSNNF